MWALTGLFIALGATYAAQSPNKDAPPASHSARPPEGLLEVPNIPPQLDQPSIQPPLLEWIVQASSPGLSVRLPIIDTDPNRGLTYGYMPVWVIPEHLREDRIKYIHAPSLTYNNIFRWSPSYRFYYYPTSDSSLTMRGSFSQFVNREAFLEYSDYAWLDRDFMTTARFQYYVDGSGRFFGVGPDSRKSNETNYILDEFEYYAAIGAPLANESPWHLNLSARLAAVNVDNGPINSLPDIDQKFPGVAPFHRQQDAEGRLFLNYDTRDAPITTTEGTFLEVFRERSARGVASAYNFQRYGLDARYFWKAPRSDRLVTAGRLKFEQLIGDAPFWLLPQLGGKYSQRAYGEGRYVDRGLITSTLEERITLLNLYMAGVTTKFEIAPFAGLATVFHSPDKMSRRYARPVYGSAFRVVVPPQVVGSIDLGLGQEGASVFMDINYSF